jgi:hypothetical protein
MKRSLLAAAAVIGLCAPALAQSTTVITSPNVGSTSTTVTIAPEERTRIKRYVVEKKMRPVTVTERVRVGATLPEDIELEAVPSDWGPSLTRYRYVYSNNDVYLVEPSSRRVIEVID